MTREARHLSCPEDVLGWIPWYSDGSLTDRQRGAVEAHASECADCRGELEMIAGAPFEIDVELPDPDRAFAEITARIAAADEEAGVIPRPPVERSDADPVESWGRIAEWVGEDDSAQGTNAINRGNVVRGPWETSPALAAAAAIVLLCMGALAGSWVSGGAGSMDSGDVYESASAETPVIGVAERGPMIDVVFRDSATANEIATMLREVGGVIVSGPTNLGVYRLRLPSLSAETAADSDSDGGALRRSSGVDLDVALSRLKSSTDGVAIFAEVVP